MAQEPKKRLPETKARGASVDGVVRYVLIASLVLTVFGFALVYLLS